jgi:hypothetical protein
VAADGSDDRGGGKAVMAVSGLTVATAVATWCLIGPLREPGPPERLDHIVRSPEVDRWIEVLVGVVAVGAALALGWATYRSRTSDRRVAVPLFVGVTGLAVTTGLVIGGGGRLLTAGGSGANIGGGMAMLFGIPTALVLGPVALFLAARWGTPANLRSDPTGSRRI